MASTPVAPVWHTAVLIAGIVALSVQSAHDIGGLQHPINRLQTYLFTAGNELLMLAWIYFGLRLKKMPLRALIGSNAGGLRTVALDLGVAAVFWISALMILGGIGVTWEIIDAAVAHRPLFPAGNQLTPDPTQQQTIHTLAQLAPANAGEVLAWIVLCSIAGIAEEIIFRGYLQRQFAAWSHGTAIIGVALSALLFGAAHGYQGARNMVLLAVFGALFSALSLWRRGLRPGIFTHGWHDLIAGIVLAALKAHHVV